SALRARGRGAVPPGEAPPPPPPRAAPPRPRRGGPPPPPRLHLHRGLAVVHRRLEQLQRVLLGPLLHAAEGRVHDVLGGALLAAVHHHVDELRHQPAPVLGVRQDFPMNRARPPH